jgi:hypothetical protein
LFIKFKKVIMGKEHVSTLKRPSLGPDEERVENQDIPASTGSEDMLSGTNRQTNHDKGWTEVKRSYARVLKGGARAANRSTRKIACNGGNGWYYINYKHIFYVLYEFRCLRVVAHSRSQIQLITPKAQSKPVTFFHDLNYITTLSST